jgi:elongation factor P--(R)-beta-lysine ligase
VNSRADERQRLAAMRPALEVRHRVLAALRRFFSDAGFLEVDTPVRIPVPALELHIDAEPAGRAYLRTSPEFHMKRLLAAGYARLFQIGPCFRRGERGRLHHPEYTMLEWYRADADYLAVLADAEALVAEAARAAHGTARAGAAGRAIDLTPPWERLSVREAFVRHAGWDPVAQFDAARFDADLVAKVEPRLPTTRPVVLMDYPVEAAALSRPKPGCPAVAERWELYIGGIEIANAFSELTDAVEQRRRFEDWARQRQAIGSAAYPLDEAFLAALEHGLPPAGGVALGVDRLVMVLCGAASLDEVLPFRGDGDGAAAG